ncbi:MAG: hypothetical protein MRQ05_04480 [Candidatus Midichloria mitochondrii]|uniref:Uncharacterized protein n=2 Tax=Candidatus Midichloria mitochondrii TaxID=234827 RepID=F7XUF7_MIDMI|nr:hypothetical protein midi_01245 [Candidatus Midichloria mitochondrii IricVA]MDJ1256670.1 hypothetical protein [Candidatus Midichloria mitochondrii]MDJ1288392.1 hypothetical protein [Candidatus Midichloria mitochondrii]MDJ1299231.1 hypothetical protein [Candidatus Midichloria mitochondrii]MDJ1313357.1 hypothetical protein [Candidatus Midichloria mitochondrii]
MSAIGGVIGSYIRRNVMDPKLYTKGRNKLVKLSVNNLFYQYRIKMLHVIFIDFLQQLAFLWW